MKIYNTLTRKKEDFVPIEEGKVKIYACGPTVYNYIHIGNARPICVFDVLRKYLIYRGYDVTFVQNFTDIDDKLINKAIEEKTTVKQLAEKYIAEYEIDAKGLNVRDADIQPRATDTIDDIIRIIKTLEEKGYAYHKDGTVYFRSRKFKGYGKLSHMPLEDLDAGNRIEVSDEKEDNLDFVLWKAAKPGEPYWQSPWGEGRPGWHIECTAMINKYLGETIDIHCGGQDLIFPHHENEIAQAEACNGKDYVHYWMHNGYINVDNKKMSKSLGNFFTTRDVAEKYGYEPIRFLMLQAHYRSPINYSIQVIEQCAASLDRLYKCKENIAFALQNAPAGEKGLQEIKEICNTRRQQFIDAMDDDLNTADAIAAVFELVRDINTFLQTEPSVSAIEEAKKCFEELTGVLGLVYVDENKNLDAEIEDLIAQRTLARKNKDFATADKIRDQLKEMNIVLEDTPQGVKWSYKK